MRVFREGAAHGFEVFDWDSPEALRSIAAELGFDQQTFDGVGFAYYHSVAQLTACTSLPIVTQEAFHAEDHFTAQKRRGGALARRHVLRSCTR